MKKILLFTLIILTQTLLSLSANNETDAYIQKLSFRGKSAYSVGDIEEAKRQFNELLSLDPSNKTAKLYLEKITLNNSLNNPTHSETKALLIQDVEKNWQLPKKPTQLTASAETLSQNPTYEKLQSIIIPKIVFQKAPLSQVIEALSELSEKLDSSNSSTPGLNIVLLNAEAENPLITIQLRNVNLGKALELITRSVNYQFNIEDEVVTVQKSSGPVVFLSTEFFPVSRASVIKMIGDKQTDAHMHQNEEAKKIKEFFIRSGIPFEKEFGAPDGADLAFDGTQIIVTNTHYNIEKTRNLLAHYKETKQVEIEAKFLEVQEGVLEELGFRWNVAQKRNPNNRFARTSSGNNNNLRDLSGTFSTNNTSANGQILIDGVNNNQPIPVRNSPPSFPNSVNLGANTTAVAGLLGVINDWQVNVMINALEQHTGSDLMSAPKLTVLSGKTAKITVAQVLRYPQSYGDIQSEVGMAGANAANSSAGVTITAGTPKDFTEKNVGVEMKVTPIVEQDNSSITLKLNPRVTEFEGFVEYGGKSVAVAGARNIVEIPSGFFQPIFSTREIETEVTIHNGATVIMGGLTREEVKSIRDKVPLLGDIPGLGRLFRSKGETNQKRNLLIFVTANLISVNGTHQNKNMINLSQNNPFTNPQIITPENHEKSK